MSTSQQFYIWSVIAATFLLTAWLVRANARADR